MSHLNFWLGLLSSVFLILGGVWGVVKMVHSLVVKSVLSQLVDIKKEVTPNGRDTGRLGDTAARTEAKVDALHELLVRYMDKTDSNTAKLERHLGEHAGDAE